MRPASAKPNALPPQLKDNPAALEIFPADLRTSANLPDAFDSVDALVHLAAAVTGPDDAQFAATVVGTEKLLAAMAKSSCKRLILASSFSVYDWSSIRGTLTEDSPLEPEPDLYDRDGYAVSKLWQERTARRMAEENGWQLTVLRPGFIWGKGNEDLSGIGQRVGPLQLVFGPWRKVPITHVENCAHCFAQATTNPAAIGQTFNIIDDELPSAWRYSRDYLRGTHTRATRLPIPYFLAITTTRLARKTSKLLFHGKGKLPSILVPTRFEARFKPLKFSNTRLHQRLNWTRPLSYAECLAHTYSTVTAAAPAPRRSEAAGSPSPTPTLATPTPT